jgi:hypothetical protein
LGTAHLRSGATVGSGLNPNVGAVPSMASRI